MGCIARLGCLILLAILGVIGWFTRDHWLPERFRTHAETSTTRGPKWEPLTDVGAQRTEAALEKLSQARGQVFQTLSGADVASFVFRALSGRLPSASDSVEALVSGDRFSMRASVRLADLGGSGVLGPLGSMLGDRERVE